MNLETAEDDLITRLETIDNVEVRSWPDDPAEFNHIHPNASILIRYNGSGYDNPPTPNNQKFLTQERTFQWVVSILRKSLRLTNGHQGIYTILESVRTTLSGYTITSQSDASIMWPVSDRFVSQAQGRWLYEMIFAFTAPETE